MANTFHRVGQGPHFVLVLHGWFGDAHAFEPIEPWLSRDHFSYVFMDCRGYGGMQDAAGQYSIDEVAHDALALADALRIDTFSVMGHSMGGMAIERIAVLAPQRVRSMLAIAPVPCGGIAYDAPTRRLLEVPRAASPPGGPSSIAAAAGVCLRPGWTGRPATQWSAPRPAHLLPIFPRGQIRISAMRSLVNIG